MTYNKGCNIETLMQNIVTRYGEEIEMLLMVTDSEYRKRPFIKPVFWLEDVIENPEKYPKLSGVDKTKQIRYISFYLKQQGRVSSNKTRNARIWMLPELKEVTA